MTIGQTEPVNIVYGNNLATKFDYDFYIETEEQLVVEHTNFSGATTTLTYGVDYSIDGIGNEDGGQINFPLQGSTYQTLGWNESTDEKEMLVISLNLPFEQAAEFDISGDLNKKNLEKALDYQMRCTQILNRKVGRAVLVSEGSESTPAELIASINEAQINAQNFAQIASDKAAAANASAISAGEEATIATRQAAEVEETYNTAMSDITSSRQTAINDIETSQAAAANEITVGRQNIASDLSAARSNINTDLTNAKNNINSTYTTNSNKLKSEYNSYTSNLGNEYNATMKAYDRQYNGVDLSVKFANEILLHNNIYEWLENRKNTNNFDGIHVRDYFYVPVKAGTVNGVSIPACNVRCRIQGINTYRKCGDTTIGNMLYIDSDHCFGPFMWNPTANNNGTSNNPNPFKASAAYAILNGINNYDATSGYNKQAHGANCADAGILQLLPSELVAVMKTKRNLLDKRYSASGLLTGSTDWGWDDEPKLTLRNEIEIYGCGIRSNLSQTTGFWFPEAGLSIQLPGYANNCENRIKYVAGSETSRCNWWLSSAASHTSSYVCSVSGGGHAGNASATHTVVYLPLCFCI